MRLSKEDYRQAVSCLKRYNYNCIKILNIRADIMSIGSPVIDGIPKAPYRISDSVYNSVIKLQEDVDLQKAIREYKAVEQAKQLVPKDSIYIFEEMYIKGKEKWEIIDDLHISEETYKRRKRNLIYAVDKEIKSLTQN